MATCNKVLYVASIERHLAHFHTAYMRYFQELGYDVHTAACGENAIGSVSRHYNLNFSRSPLGFSNISAYCQLKRIIRENGYSLIHCHTPVASILTRLAARKMRSQGTIVIYTVHGFHFFDGNKVLKNFLFRNIEKFVSRYTDCIITINNEDYRALERYDFKARESFLTHGMGIDGNRFSPVDPGVKAQRRAEFNLKADEYVVIYPAEYSMRKNHRDLLHAVALLKNRQEEIIALLPGLGAEWANLNKLAKELGIEDNIRFLGPRPDVEILYSVSDLSLAPSRQEGLPTHVIEAMASGLPCVASRIRGHVDLVEDGVNGLLYDGDKPEEMAGCILRLKGDPALAMQMRENNIRKAQNYFLANTFNEMAAIYGKLIERK